MLKKGRALLFGARERRRTGVDILKIDRLIGIVMILLQQEKATAPELAERFEVSRRTINRDIDDLCRAGIPLVTTQGYGGGVSISPGYTVDRAFFTQEELQAILAGLQSLDSVSMSPAGKRAGEKLSPNQSAVTDDVVRIDLASHDVGPLSEKIAVIRNAILARRMLVFHYCSEKGETERRVEPYRLVFQWSAWYILAYCLERQAFRLFKLNRLWNLRVEEDSFQRRALPDAALDLNRYFHDARNYRLRAVFSPGEKYRLIEEYGVDCFSETEEGLLFERDFASYENMRSWVMSFGDRVDVLAPQMLAEDRIKQAQKILDRRKQGGT